MNSSQTIGEKFHLLVEQSLPTIDSLDELRVAGLELQVATLEYFFTPGADRETSLKNWQTSRINLMRIWKYMKGWLTNTFQMTLT